MADYGILGPVQQMASWQQPVGILGAALKDAGAYLSGHPADANSVMQYGLLTQQNQARQAAQQAIGQAQSSDPASRQAAYATLRGMGIDTTPFERAAASQALPQLLQSMQPSMGFNDNPVAVTPAVNATGPDVAAQRQAAQAVNAAPAMSMQPGLPLPQAIAKSSPELQAELAPQLIQNAINMQTKAKRPATPEEKAAYGVSQKTPLVIDAEGNATVLSDPNTITDFQKANLARLDANAAEDRRHHLAVEAKTGEATKPPVGYRFKANGVDLEYIPGGPADPTKGAGKKAPTEDQAKNNQLYTRASQQLPIALKNFDALGGLGNQVGRTAAGVLSLGHADPNVFTGNEGQQASNAIKDISASYLYSVSGATANPGEVANLAETVMPKLYDSKEVVAQKKDRLRQMVESIKLRAQPGVSAPEQPKPLPSPGSLPRKAASKTIRFEDLP